MEGRGREKKAKKERGSSWLQESGRGPGCLMKGTGEGRMWYIFREEDLKGVGEKGRASLKTFTQKL